MAAGDVRVCPVCHLTPTPVGPQCPHCVVHEIHKNSEARIATVQQRTEQQVQDLLAKVNEVRINTARRIEAERREMDQLLLQARRQIPDAD
jgi:hypothetical protein